MKSLKTLLLLMSALTIAMVSGCGNDGKYEGKTAKEWADEKAALEKSIAAKPAVPAPQEAKEQKAGPTEAELEQEQKKADESFLANAGEQTKAIASSKDGAILSEAAREGLSKVSTGEISLNHMAGLFLDGTMWKIVPDVRNGTIPGPDYKVVLEGHRKIRQTVIAWLTGDMKRMDAVWATVRPIIRQKYALLNTLRGHEKLFRTAYTQKSFAPLYECLKWHENLIYAAGDTKPADPNPKDKANCDKIFKTFGMSGVSFGVKNEDSGMTRGNVAFDNALWVVEFLKRREADGGEKFAQKFQVLALDYIK